MRDFNGEGHHYAQLQWLNYSKVGGGTLIIIIIIQSFL